MYCPFCNKEETKVTDSRLVTDGSQIRRRRECLSCGERFTTLETAALALPHIIKRDGSRSRFDEQKLRAGILRALERRPVNTEQVEAAISRLIHKLQVNGEREISSQLLGEWVMEELRGLDEVAYVRFASVYRSFQDVSEFHEVIRRLRTANKEAENEIIEGQNP